MSGVFQYLVLFSATSSIHGLNHLTARQRAPIEYVLWALSLAVALTMTVMLSMSSMSRYEDSPTVISMERDYMEWNTSHPAITVCPDRKWSVELLRRAVEEMLSTTDEADQLSTLLEHIATADYEHFHVSDVTNNNISYSLAADEYLAIRMKVSWEFMYAVSVPLEGIHEKTLQRNVNENGICYTFNSKLAFYFHPKFWSGEEKKAPSNAGNIESNPLDGQIFAKLSTMNSGAKIYVHGCTELPDASSRPLNIFQTFYKILDFTALSISSTDEVRSLSVKQRKCRFIEESNLHIAPLYSYNLCRMECRMEYSNRLCGCVPHFYRHIKGYRTCDVNQWRCLDDKAELLINLWETYNGTRVACDCLPQCDDVNYALDQDRDVRWSFGTEIRWGLSRYPRMRLKRDILFGFTELLVSIGGSAGLFLGCSLLSFIEIIYFFTLKLYCYWLRRSH